MKYKLLRLAGIDAVILVCVAPISIATSSGADSPSNIRLEDIIQVWRNKEESSETARVEWNEQRFNSVVRLSPDASIGIGPTQDVTYKRLRGVVFRGNSIRFTDSGDIVTSDRDNLLPYNRENIWHNLAGEDLEYHRVADDSVGFRLHSLVGEAEFEFMREVDLLPIAFGFRPAQWGISTISSDMIVGGQGYIGDTRCLILEESSRTRSPSRSWVSLWLDPENDYVVRRFSRKRGNDEILRVDITYAQHKDGSLFPSEWTWLTYNDVKSVGQQVKADVTMCRINEPVSDDEFSFSFPVGTVVRDRVAEPEYYVARSGGRKEPLSFNEWLRASSLDGGRDNRDLNPNEITAPWSSWPFRVSTVAVIAVLLVLIYRRRFSDDRSLH